MHPVPEREAAKAAGERFYFTGKPCKNGHLSKRYTGTGICAKCAVKNTLNCKTPEHPNRIAAREAGERHYAIGVTCKHGHEDKRFVANGICVGCSAIRTRRYHAERPGLEAKWARERRAKDPTSHRAEVKRWAKKNPDRIKQALNDWKAANIEYWRAYQATYRRQRRSKETENGGAHTVDDIEHLRAKQGGKCAGCLKKPNKLEVDHIIPVIRGGSNDPSNLQLLCLKCNRSKGSRDAVEWAQLHGRLL